MEAINRLEWAAGASIAAYGVRIGIRVTDPAVMHQVLDHLPPLWRPARTSVVGRLYSLVVGGMGSRPNMRRFNLLYADANRLARTLELSSALDAFDSDLQLYVAENAPRRLFVHAGVVGWKGRAIVLPGRSFSGKTSLVVELVKAGAIYYSDEYAVLDERGRVYPYPRRLSVRQQEDGRPNRPQRYRAEALGGISGIRPLPVGLVVLTRYKPGARWRPRRLTAGEGALGLLENTVSVRRQPPRALLTLRRVLARAPAIRSWRGEARGVVNSILKLVCP